MAHMILANDSMFSVGETPWHKLGIVLNDPPSIQEAIIAAKLDWQVGTKPLFTAEGTAVEARATYRVDTNEILGVVGPDYKPLQNAKAFEFFQPFLDTKAASLETAGSLRGNRRVWVLAKINRDPSVIKGDDIVNKYVLLSNSHDGTLAVRVGFTPIRVVCNNTLTLAHDSGASQLIRIKHTQNVEQNLVAVQEVMDVANAKFEATAEQYRALAARDINQKDLEKYVKVVFATSAQLDKMMKGEDVEAGKKTLEKIQRLFETGRGSDLPGARGTLWGAVNAVAEYVQYERGNDIATRLNETWFGSGAQLNRKALQTAVAMAA